MRQNLSRFFDVRFFGEALGRVGRPERKQLSSNQRTKPGTVSNPNPRFEDGLTGGVYEIANKTRFHIVRETPSRPRLQCMDCRFLDKMDTYAKNRPLPHGMVNSWFMTHKAFVLMKKIHLLKDRVSTAHLAGLVSRNLRSLPSSPLPTQDEEKSRGMTSDEWGENRTVIRLAPLHLTATGNSFALE